MEAKHTPGPWRVEGGTTLIWGDCNPDDTTSYGLGYPIAECRHTPAASWSRGPSKYEEAEANARLISAAPELLELIERAHEADCPDEDIRTAWWEARAAAIAKATGSPA